MWGSTCIPRNVYQVLYPLKGHFCCVQAQHFLAFCWLLIALIRDPGKGILKGLKPYLPPTLKYRTTVRLIRSRPWDAEAAWCDMATATRRALPPPADGGVSLTGASTLQTKRGWKHPLDRTTCRSEHEP
jgi:hypothetical protein